MGNPGKIVKKIAIALFVIMVILSIILASYVGDNLPDRTEGIGAMSAFIMGVAASACFSVLIYAFGDLVEKTSDTNTVVRKIESYTRNLKITYQDEQANREAEEKAKREAEEKAKREAEEKAKREAEENARHERETRKKLLSTKTSVTKTIVPMNEPNNFQNNPDWENEIATLSDNEIYTRYIDEVEWSETYRYHCYLELKKRDLQSIQIITNHIEEQNELKILPNGKGYICPLCGFSNASFSSCAQCGCNPFENPSEETNGNEDEYVDIACPACGETLSFLKNETKGVCPNCATEFEIK